MGELLVVATSAGLALAIVLHLEPTFRTKHAIVFYATVFEVFLMSGIAHVELLKHHFLLLRLIN